MKQRNQAVIETTRPRQREGRLDLVIPFTTPALTEAALNAARKSPFLNSEAHT